jgi:hypothetical protein
MCGLRIVQSRVIALPVMDPCLQPASPWWRSTKVVCIADCNEFEDGQDPAGVMPEDAGHARHESHFGCARCLVWGIVFEAGLVITMLLCWQLRLYLWR